MKGSIEKRVGKLEEKRKPRLIATVADLMMWASDMFGDEEVELSPQMQELVDEANKHAEEKAREQEAREQDVKHDGN